MAWRRSLVALFDTLAPDIAGLARRKMFSYPSAFLGGHLCFGLYEHRLVVRLPPERRVELLTAGTVSVFKPMAGRPMTNFAAVEDPLARDRAEIDALIGEAVACVRTMPPKPERRPGRRKAPRRARRPSSPIRGN